MTLCRTCIIISLAYSFRQMMQLGQNNMVSSNNGWSGMLTQNLQPAPGSNPFLNLTAQQQQTAAFTAQVCKFQ